MTFIFKIILIFILILPNFFALGQVKFIFPANGKIIKEFNGENKQGIEIENL